jgi:hypothetical protein
MNALNSSSQELYLLFLEFRDLMGIQSNCFLLRIRELNLKSFIDKIVVQIEQFSKRPAHFLMEELMPGKVRADFERYNYLIRKTVQYS